MPSQPFGTPGSYGDRLRAKGVQIDAGQAKSTRKGERASNAKYNGWEKGVTGEKRPDGSFMPYLDTSGDVIKNKAMSSGTYDGAKRALRDLRSGAVTQGVNSG